MTPTQCVDLVEFIAGRCPAMRMQDNTPDSWYVDLQGFDLAVGLEAARRVTLDKTFIGIGDLVAGCQAVVREIEGRQRQAELDAQLVAENPGEALALRESSARAAIEAAKPKLTVRRELRWQPPSAGRKEKPPLTDAELAAAAELLANAAAEPEAS